MECILLCFCIMPNFQNHTPMERMKNFQIANLRICLIFLLLLPIFKATHGQSSQFMYHVVEPGQNLFRISIKYQTSVEELRHWNGIKGNTIRVGQKLIVGKRLSPRKSKPDPFGDGLPWDDAEKETERYTRPDYGSTRKQISDPGEFSVFEKEEQTQASNTLSGTQHSSNLYTLFLGKPFLAGKHNYGYGAGTDQMEMLGHLLSQQEGKTYGRVEIMSFKGGPSAYNSFNQRLKSLGRTTKSNDVLFLNVYASSENENGKVEIISSSDEKELTRGLRPNFRQILKLSESVSGKKLIICDVNVSRADAEAYIESCNLTGEEVAIFLSSWKKDFSNSGGKWHHGAIFKAFTLALKGAADFNRDGEITLTEADIYLNDKVSELTGSVQYGHMIYNSFTNPDQVVLTRLY